MLAFENKKYIMPPNCMAKLISRTIWGPSLNFFTSLEQRQQLGDRVWKSRCPHLWRDEKIGCPRATWKPSTQEATPTCLTTMCIYIYVYIYTYIHNHQRFKWGPTQNVSYIFQGVFEGGLENVSLHFEGILKTLPTKTKPGGSSATNFAFKGGPPEKEP